MADTSAPVIPGSEFDAADHGHDMSSTIAVARMYGVLLPARPRGFNTNPTCLVEHPTGWACTRAKGHGRRHHASFPQGDGEIVLAVWHQDTY